MATAKLDERRNEQVKEVAANLLEQLNKARTQGFPLLAFIGAQRNSFMLLNEKAGGLSFMVGKATSGSKANKVRIIYDYGADLYDVEFWHVGKRALDVYEVKGDKGLDVEQMLDYIARELVAGAEGL